MTDRDNDIEALFRRVTLDRKKGDAKRKQGHADEAQQEYRTAVRRIDEFLAASANDGADLKPEEGAEVFGIRGGLLHRCNDLRQALSSYKRGAEFERAGDLASTYNRINAVKFALLTGSSTSAQLRQEIDAAEAALRDRIRQDVEAAEDGWLWADLGDVRLLRGDAAGAEEAYSLFVRKASSGSPATTLSMLERVAAALERHADPAARDVSAALDRVRPLLGDPA